MGAIEFVAAARALKGAKWRHRGRKSWAVDCVGLIALAGTKAGMTAEDEKGYGREPWEDRLRKGCVSRWGAALPLHSARPGDVALIRWGSGEPSHLAVIGDHPGGGLTLIHAHTQKGVIEQGMLPKVVVEVYRPWRA